jgi:hypothetical protein
MYHDEEKCECTQNFYQKSFKKETTWEARVLMQDLGQTV